MQRTLLVCALARLQSCASSAAIDADEHDVARPLLFVGIYTAPGNAARRDEIRSTFLEDPALIGGIVEARFVVGEPKSGSAEKLALEQEAFSYPQQFLHLPVPDAYDTLTEKTLAFFTWFATYSRARYVLKLDDDTYPHFDRIVPRLQDEPSRYVQMGLLLDCNPVLSTGKWAQDSAVWPHEFYPKHMQGSGYILSSELVQELVVHRFEHHGHMMLQNEDATVGLWLELDKQADPSFDVHMKQIPATLSGCSQDDLLSMNNLPGYMTCYWNRKVRGERDICCYGPLNNLRQSFLQVSSAMNTAVSSFDGERPQSSAGNQSRCYKGAITAE